MKNEVKNQYMPRMPKIAFKLVFFMFATSSFVFIEPAPFDILFTIIFTFLFITPVLDFPVQLSRYYLLLTLFILTSFISLPLSIVDINHAYFFLAITVYLVLLSLFIAALIARYGYQAINCIFQAMAISFVISLFISYLALFDILPLYETVTFFGGRFRAFFKDGNVLGPTLIPMILYVIYMMHTQRKNKFWYLFLLILFTLSLTITYSRAAFGLLFVAIGGFYLLFFREKSIKYLLAGVPFFFIFGIIILLVMQELGTFELFTDRLSIQYYDTGRFYVQKFFLSKVELYPFGIGPGQGDIWLGVNYDNITSLGSASVQHTLLRVLVENGIITFIPFVIFFFYSLWISFKLSIKNWDYKGISSVCCSTLFCYFIASLVVDTLHWRIYWIISGLVMGIHAIHLRKLK